MRPWRERVRRVGVAALGAAAAIAAAASAPSTVHAREKPSSFDVLDQHTTTITSFFDKARNVGGPGQPSRDVRPGLGFHLRNKADRQLWFEVSCLRCSDPYPGVTATKEAELAPGERAKFTFAQDTLVADVDYVFSVLVFADSSLRDTVERATTTMRINAAQFRYQYREIEDARQRIDDKTPRLDPRELPRAYEGIVLRDKFGITAKPVGGQFHGGTLVVRAEGLEYSTNSTTRSYGIAQIRDLAQRIGRTGHYIDVDYDEAGKTKRLRLEIALMSGHYVEYLDQVETSIREAIARRDSTPARKTD